MTPSPAAPKPLRVAVLGFSAFERNALEVFFRLASARQPSYSAAPSLDDCDFVIADADFDDGLRQVVAVGCLDRTVFIGPHAAPEGALGALPRPIDPLHVMRLLDLAVSQARLALARAHERAQHRPSARARQAARQDRVQDFHATTGFSNSVLADGDLRLDEVLVVDDSPIARRFLESRLSRVGYPVTGVETGEQALAAVAERHFGFVFLDVNLDGIDGFETCRLIKAQALPGRRVPVVVIVTGRTGATDRIRGTLAGCDAYLTKPVVEDQLLQVLTQFDDAFERVFEDTSPSQLSDL